MKVRVLPFGVLAAALCVYAQQSSPATSDKDVDPLALKVLKAATDPIRDAKSYSFRALVSREREATNGQIITLFHSSDVTVERPDKLHVEFHGLGKEVQLFYNGGQFVLYTPEEKLYTTVSAPKSIDATLQELEQRDVFIPISNFLQSDPYTSLSDDLVTGYVVGKVVLFDQTVHHLAFTEPDADWQLWVVGGDKPRIRRLQVVDKSKPERPRIVVDFFDWNMEAKPDPELFTFTRPADAKQIELLKEAPRK